MNRGKLTIVSIFVLAGSLTAFAVWYRHYAGRLCLEYWGAEAAVRIQESKDVQLWKLEPVDQSMSTTPDSAEKKDPLQTIEVLGEKYEVTSVEDISQKSGLKHLQRALIEDRTYVWGPRATDSDIAGGDDSEDDSGGDNGKWEYVLVFRDAAGESRVAFDIKSQRVGDVSRDATAVLDATKMAKFLRIFFSKSADTR